MQFFRISTSEYFIKRSLSDTFINRNKVLRKLNYRDSVEKTDLPIIN